MHLLDAASRVQRTCLRGPGGTFPCGAGPDRRLAHCISGRSHSARTGGPMPTQQAQRGQTTKAKKGTTGAGRSDEAIARQQPSAALPTSDEIYGVVSVLYHALQGAETIEDYVEDAEMSNDTELVE